jgi:small subunit ribosomal protein S16
MFLFLVGYFFRVPILFIDSQPRLLYNALELFVYLTVKVVVVIRLQRVGRRNRPSYRIVAADRRCPVQGKFLEIVGFYDPINKQCKLEKDAMDAWVKKGAQMSKTVAFLYGTDGKLNTEKKPKLNRKAKLRAAAAEEAKAEAKAEAEAAAQAKKEAEATETEVAAE